MTGSLGMPPPGVSIRPAGTDDDASVVALLTRTLGWEDDERHRALFHWKHRANPFGPSPGWVAEDEGGIVGSRTFMRWEFRVGGETISAVRAVDTATAPRAQGRGVFRALTLTGVDEMTSAGVGWAFNTPNANSAPGYLSMGWEKVGALPVAFRPCRLSALPRIVSARRPSSLWSIPTTFGEEASAVLDDEEITGELLAWQVPTGGVITTHRTAAFLRWRYGQCPVGYRALLAGSRVDEGVLFFRLRHRGRAVELVVADLIVEPRSRDKVFSRLWRQLVDGTQADYAVAVGPSHPTHWLPVPRSRPLLTWRELSRKGPMPELNAWDLSAGDIELF